MALSALGASPARRAGSSPCRGALGADTNNSMLRMSRERKKNSNKVKEEAAGGAPRLGPGRPVGAGRWPGGAKPVQSAGSGTPVFKSFLIKQLEAVSKI